MWTLFIGMHTYSCDGNVVCIAVTFCMFVLCLCSTETRQFGFLTTWIFVDEYIRHQHCLITLVWTLWNYRYHICAVSLISQTKGDILLQRSLILFWDTRCHHTLKMILRSMIYPSLYQIACLMECWVISLFCISLSLRLSLSSKFGLRPKISQKVKSFFCFDLAITEWSLRPKIGPSDR